MDFYGDYHTHTPYSHGKGTILQNAEAAAAKGFKQVAITDHGFRHMAYNAKRRFVPDMQKEIAAAKQACGIDVLFGLETNITGMGAIDIRPSDYEFLDIILCGYHKFVAPKRARDFRHFFGNLMFYGREWHTKKWLQRNTDVYRSVIESYKIDVITHINLGMRVDCRQVAALCKETGTMIELNGKGIAFTDDELRAMIETGVQFIVNSDAHSADRVGDFSVPLALLQRVPVPEAQIANLNKKPVFRSQKDRR